MVVKKSGNTIFGADLSRAEKKALEIEVRKFVAEHSREHFDDIDASVLWALHDVLGLGKKRLHDFYVAYAASLRDLCDYYEVGHGEEDEGWICRRKLKEIGVDIEEWSKERSDKND